MTELEPHHGQLPAAPTPADHHLSPDTEQRIQDAIPGNTRRAYTRHWNDFTTWCTGENRTPLPATPETLTEYTGHLARHGKSATIIEQAIATIRTQHRNAGHEGQPSTAGSRLVLRDHRRTHGSRPKQATPLLVDAIRAMVGCCDLGTLRGLRDRAVVVLGFTMMSRRSELTGLDHDDATETSAGLEIYLRSSKTDQDAKGTTIVIPWGEHDATCPVIAVGAWQNALRIHGYYSGRLLRSIDRWNNIGESLSGDAIADIIRRLTRDAGLPAGAYSPHGLRAGGATAAANAGAHVTDIARHGRWSINSPTVHRYIRNPNANPMRGIGL